MYSGRYSRTGYRGLPNHPAATIGQHGWHFAIIRGMLAGFGYPAL
ncbi:hypothetical protein YSA_06411 [Pseudomonas putida ND6]|uniref:Uncharacterized protein n=1 Tax=Pseudomonas putida ND6 TaxID=231023 RepID=I3UXK4_PSEPU|nr:hypothetical protein YSA_06411 [Pseudomonas putida ND6]